MVNGHTCLMLLAAVVLEDLAHVDVPCPFLLDPLVHRFHVPVSRVHQLSGMAAPRVTYTVHTV